MVTPRLLNEIYWAAGFIEGDGCFSNTGKTPQVSAAQSYTKEPLERLEKIFGGTISELRPKVFQWRIYGAKAIGVMFTLYSMMSEKRRKQIEEAVTKWKLLKRDHRIKDFHLCKRGHDLRVVGLTTGNSCRGCKNQQVRDYYNRRKE